jgi:hypothetical protein
MKSLCFSKAILKQSNGEKTEIVYAKKRILASLLGSIIV